MKKWIFGILIVIAAFITYGVHVYNTTMNGKLQTESKSVQTAKEKAKLTKITSVDYYHGITASYEVVQGTDNKGEQWIVWVPDKEGKVLTKKKSEGISEKEAMQIVAKNGNPKELVKVKLGAENNVPIWEVTYIDQENHYNYYYMEFANGDFWRRYSI
ncbi:DUF5590 domain-containing protein [Microbacteriaceae bacterium 4G12]